MFEITGTVKYARRMKGKAEGSGKEYDFFSMIVLDPDEGERVMMQMTEDNPQFAELCQKEKTLVDQPVKIVIRRCSAGMKKDKDTGKSEPVARFFIKKVLFPTSSAAAR